MKTKMNDGLSGPRSSPRLVLERLTKVIALLSDLPNPELQHLQRRARRLRKEIESSQAHL